MTIPFVPTEPFVPSINKVHINFGSASPPLSLCPLLNNKMTSMKTFVLWLHNLTILTRPSYSNTCVLYGCFLNVQLISPFPQVFDELSMIYQNKYHVRGHLENQAFAEWVQSWEHFGSHGISWTLFRSSKFSKLYSIQDSCNENNVYGKKHLQKEQARNK